MSESHIRVDVGDGVRLLLDRYVSGEIARADADKIRLHLNSCRSCSELFKETVRLRTLVRCAVCRETPRESLKQAIREMIRSD